MEKLKRRSLLHKQEKWGKFRQARDLVFMDYIEIKKNQRKAEFWQLIFTLNKYIKTLNYLMKKEEFQKEAELFAAFMCLKVKMVWKKRMIRWGGSQEKVYQNRIHRTFTFMGLFLGNI